MPKFLVQVGAWLATAIEVLWGFALGAVILWAFFLVMGAVSLAHPLWLTIVMAVLGLAALVHLAREHRMLDRDRDLARRAHALRERRGF